MNEREIYAEALAKGTAAERAAFLDSACGADAGLRARIEALLAEQDKLGSFLESPPAAVVANQSPTIGQEPSDAVGTQIGPYKLLQQIGEGGMGTVYMAEQVHPVRRKVALKIIKPGLDTRQVIARFEAERQALSLMDHPNIAKVLDAGTTDGGRPYFVMELVKGQPITQYCDEKRLTPRERLELLLPVCQAVQHAHQKGIIHRDLKPSNVLVAEYDQKAVPKVIDFGVAKAISQPLTEKTIFTALGQIVGTLEYMSPEQAKLNQLDIDTRSDIYSLGVLMYELLTGTTPFDKQRLRSAAWDEMLRVIREEEPPKPSTRLSESKDSLPSISAQRHTEPAKLTKLVRGELDWIVMKAIEKDRARRYETANGLAHDLQRYLNDEPVVACPPTIAYRFRKFARRNKARLGAAALIAVALFLGLTGITWALRDRLVRQREAARERDARVVRVAAQIELILTDVHRLMAQENWPEALRAVRSAGPPLASGEVDEATRQQVSDLLRDLDFVAKLERIRVDGAVTVNGEFDDEKLLRSYAQAFHDFGIDAEQDPIETSLARLKVRPVLALPLATAMDQWAEARRRRSGRDDPMRKRLITLARRLDPDPFRDRLRQHLEHWVPGRTEAALPPLDNQEIEKQSSATIVLLASVLRFANQPDKAIEILKSAQFRDPGDFWLNFELGALLVELKAPEDAVRYSLAAVALSPDCSAGFSNLGLELADSGRIDEAIACFRKAIELDPRLVAAYVNLGGSLEELGEIDEAIRVHRRTIELAPDRAMSHLGLSRALRTKGQLDAAMDACRRAIEIDGAFAESHDVLGVLLNDKGESDAAIACHRRALELDPNLAAAHNNLGLALKAQNKLDDAVASYRRALELDPKHANAYLNLGIALESQGKADEALDLYVKALDLDRKLEGAYLNLSLLLLSQGKADEAIRCCRRALELNPNWPEALTNLGNALQTKGKIDEAMDCYRKALTFNPKKHEALVGLGMVFGKQGKLEEAIACYRRAIEADPNRANPIHGLVRALSDMGRTEEATNVVRDALERWPRDAKLHNQMGILLIQKKEFDEAIAWFKKALALDASLAPVHYNLGKTLLAKDEIDAAVACFRKAVELDPEIALAHFHLGFTLQTQERLNEAISCYLRAIEVNPKHADAHNNLAWLLVTATDANLRDPPRAVEAARTAVQLSEENGGYHNTLGVAFYRNGQYQEAIAALEKSLALVKDQAVAHNGLFVAMAHWKLGEQEIARQWFDKSVQWMETQKQTDEELRRVHAEAAALLGPPGKAPP